MHAPKPPTRSRRLSLAQEQLWFLDQLTPGEATYNILMAWRLSGRLRVDVLSRALDRVVARHESLRATIRAEDGTPYQVVAPAGPVPLPVTDLRELPAAERERRVLAELDAERAEPYDLAAGPLCRFRLLRVDAEEYVFLQGFHHVITDGWSAGLVNAELSTAYAALLDGAEPEFGPRELDYTEYAEAQREQLRGDVLAEELEFWRRELAGLPVLDLPADRPRPTGAGHRGETLVRHLPEDLRAVAQRLAEDNGASMFMVFAAACAVVLGRYARLEDVPIGIPMLGRPDPELEAVVGMFINMVVLRCDLSGDPTFGELVERVADATLELYDHQEVAFNQVVDAVQPEREPGRNPLFQVSVQLLGASNSGENLVLPGVSAEFVPLASVRSRFDLAVNLFDTGTRLRAALEYSADMFDGWRVEALLGHLETLLRGAADDPERRLSELPIVTGAEAAELRAAGRGAAVGYGDEPLPALLAAVARRWPEAIAVTGDGGELTYAELVRRAELQAHRLRAAGAQAGETIEVDQDGGVDACVTALGALRAGCAYSGPGSARPTVTRETDTSAGPYEATGAPSSDDAAGPPAQWASTDAVACFGPAGEPVTHHALAAAAESARRSWDLGPGDRVLCRPDAALWATLLAGATAVVAGGTDPAALARAHAVTHVALPSEVVPGFEGPRPVAAPLPADRPMSVVDPAGNLVPRGVPGELLADGRPTGDLVRWTADLRIEYLGRLADQVAVRGVHVDLGEVAAVAGRHPSVGRAVVVARPGEDGEPRLVGHLTRIGGATPSPEDLRAHLTATLPAYAVPSAWVAHDELPRGADGRIDRAALPDTPAIVPDGTADAGDEPRTETERSVAGIFGAVLSRPRMGPEENFFEVGGNSLQAMRVVSRINKTFGIKLSVRTLYGNVTVRAVSAVVDEKVGGGFA
ncbi:MAG TPA: condensation domain-containing protein [Pseudonocardiaceae bacterium]